MPIPSRRRWAAPWFAVALLAAACGDDPEPTTSDSRVGVTDDADRADPSSSTPFEASEPAGSGVTPPWPVNPPGSGSVAQWRVEIVNRIDHDTSAFTQGLEVHDGIGFESTGRYGESTIRRFDPATGVALATVELDPAYYGEGLTVVGDTIVQLTWREGTALRWDRTTLEPLEPFEYDGEGWGICASGAVLVMSDGTSRIRRIAPLDFVVESTVEVTLEGEPVESLNELECVDDLVVANVWKTSRLVVFDPGTGVVVADVDASALTREMNAVLAVDDQNALNGIAGLDDGTLLLTGKRWPTMFQVRLVES